jgi:hypothetical protein
MNFTPTALFDFSPTIFDVPITAAPITATTTVQEKA